MGIKLRFYVQLLQYNFNNRLCELSYTNTDTYTIYRYVGVKVEVANVGEEFENLKS